MRYLALLLLIAFANAKPSNEDETSDNADDPDPELYSQSGNPNPEQWKLPIPPLPKLTAPRHSPSKVDYSGAGSAMTPLNINPLYTPHSYPYGQPYWRGNSMYPMYKTPNLYGYGRYGQAPVGGPMSMG